MCIRDRMEARSRRNRIVAQLQAQQVFILDQAIADRSVVFENAAVTECCKNGIVKATCTLEIAETQREVVQHADILAKHARAALAGFYPAVAPRLQVTS